MVIYANTAANSYCSCIQQKTVLRRSQLFTWQEFCVRKTDTRTQDDKGLQPSPPQLSSLPEMAAWVFFSSCGCFLCHSQWTHRPPNGANNTFSHLSTGNWWAGEGWIFLPSVLLSPSQLSPCSAWGIRSCSCCLRGMRNGPEEPRPNSLKILCLGQRKAVMLSLCCTSHWY